MYSPVGESRRAPTSWSEGGRTAKTVPWAASLGDFRFNWAASLGDLRYNWAECLGDFRYNWAECLGDFRYEYSVSNQQAVDFNDEIDARD